MAAAVEEVETFGKDEEEKDREEIEIDLANCAEDFAHYLHVDPGSEIKGLENTIEDMLAKLDEFSHLADTIRTDSSLSIHEVIPSLHSKTLELQPLFDKIDSLEAFVDVVHQNVEEMEEHVSKAEKNLGVSSIKRVMSSLPSFMQKKGAQLSPRQQQHAQWEPPKIFHTEDFFSKYDQADITELKPDER